MSDGEIVEDLSEISSEENEDYFEHLRKLGERKLQLEIENSLVSVGTFGKSAVLFYIAPVNISCFMQYES